MLGHITNDLEEFSVGYLTNHLAIAVNPHGIVPHDPDCWGYVCLSYFHLVLHLLPVFGRAFHSSYFNVGDGRAIKCANISSRRALHDPYSLV